MSLPTPIEPARREVLPARKRSSDRQWAAAAVTALACCLLTLASADDRAAAAPAFDAGPFGLRWAPPPNWRVKAFRDVHCVTLQYQEEPAETVAATIGVFRYVVPPAGRSGDRLQLAAAYAIHDVAGTRKALFNSAERLTLQSKAPKAIGGGQLFSYLEPVDATYSRSSSTEFFRAWVFFPRDYAEHGAIYLVLGREQSVMLESKPTVLEVIDDIVAGIRESTMSSGR